MTKSIKKRSHHKKPPVLRLVRHPIPKTLYAAVDTLGKPRFTNDDPGLVDTWIGKLKKFYSVQVYDLRTAKVAAKPSQGLAGAPTAVSRSTKKPTKKPAKK
jgi:hypothetical protein